MAALSFQPNRSCTAVARPNRFQTFSGSVSSLPAAWRGRCRSTFTAGGAARERRTALPIQNWALFKALGLQKPSWLPDFGQAKRKAILDRFYGRIDREVYQEVLDDSFRMYEQLRSQAGNPRSYGKDDWIELMCNNVAPALPDFTWSAATDGKADKDGWALVVVKVSGHHTGQPFALPGLPPVAPSGRRVTLQEEMMRVRVEGGRIKEIVVLPSEGAGPLALYSALGGQLEARRA